MLTKLMLSILMLAVFSCGRNPDCPDCPPPTPPGAPPEPTPPEQPTPLPPTPPPAPEPLPPPEEREEVKTCALKWMLDGTPVGRYYDLEYIVVTTISKEVHVSFTWNYVTANGSTEKQTATKKFPAGEKDAEVSTLTWRASLSKDGALFKNVALNKERTAPCK